MSRYIFQDSKNKNNDKNQVPNYHPKFWLHHLKNQVTGDFPTVPGYLWLGGEEETIHSPLNSIRPGRSEQGHAGDLECRQGRGLPSPLCGGSPRCLRVLGLPRRGSQALDLLPALKDEVTMTGQWWVRGEAGLDLSPGYSMQASECLHPQQYMGRNVKAALLG